MTRFGGSWTEDKLSRLEKYLRAYTKIFHVNPKAMSFETTYVDAFAGTGYRTNPSSGDEGFLPLDDDAESVRAGSAVKALEVAPRFTRYIFIENNPDYAEALQRLKARYPDKADSIEIVRADANQKLRQWCHDTDWRRHRAVVFLTRTEWRWIGIRSSRLPTRER